MTIRGIVFDLDETLIDRTGAVEEFAQALWQQYLSGTEATAQTFIDKVHQIDGHGYTPRGLFFEQMWENLAGIIPSRKIVEQAFFNEVWETPRLADDVIEVLAALGNDNIPLAIVSNGSTQAQETKIKRSGLAAYFEAIVISETFGAKKPDPSIYLEATSILGLNPGECWFVGDHPVNDVWGSKQVGYHAAWVHLDRPWATDLDHCYEVKGATFGDTMNQVMEGN